MYHSQKTSGCSPKAKRASLISIVVTTLFAGTLSAEVNTVEIERLLIDQEQNARSGFQLTGYASLGYSDAASEDSTFDAVKFAPILQYGYSDILQFDAEIEFEIEADGETEIALEYAAANLFLNDYMALVMGKFLSPIGQFRQNYHPSWINKLPSEPVGFGHDGAAPIANVGAALRGGLPKVFGIRHNYTLYVSNAPTLSDNDGEVEIGTEGSTSSNSTPLNIGGRYAIDPISGMEVGVSGAYGQIAELNATGDHLRSRDYRVYGADITYNITGFDLRGEYVAQDIDDDPASLIEGGIWEAWYVQAAYQISAVHLEPVIRYGAYTNPDLDRKQTAVGLNYLFANNIIAKIAYEFNNVKDSTENDDRFLAQFAFGF